MSPESGPSRLRGILALVRERAGASAPARAQAELRGVLA